MSQLYDKNLKLLEKKYPGIKEIIEKKSEFLLEKEKITIAEEKAITGERILRVQQENGRKLYLAGKRNPKMPAINQIGMLGKIESTAPVFIIGLGNEYYIRELYKKIEKNTMVLIYEPSFSIFKSQIENIDFSFLFEKGITALFVGEINDEMRDLKILFQMMLKGDRVPIMKHFIVPNYEIICKDKTYNFTRELTEIARQYTMNVSTKDLFSDVAVDNVLHNVNYARTGYKAGQIPDVIPRDIPAIVVSAGPSLNKNIKQLKKAKNKAFIIAVDTAIKPLIKAGIIPDMYATIDGKKLLELVQIEESRKIPLISNIDASRVLLEYHKGKKFFYREGYNYVNRIYEINKKPFEILPTGGSVATLAFSLVCHVGFKTVILVGQDLAFTGNKSHADGTFEANMKEQDTSKYIMIPGNYEEKVPTLFNLNEYRLWFERFIKQWKECYTTRFINATEGGALIEGTELMTLEEAIQQECQKEIDISACIEKLNPVFNEAEQKKILEYFHATSMELQNIRALAQEGKKLYQKLGKMCTNGNVDKNAYLKILNKVKKNTKKIEKNVTYQLISITLSKANQIIQSAQYLGYQSFEEEGLRIADKGEKFMDLIEQCSEILEDLAEDTVSKVE